MLPLSTYLDYRLYLRDYFTDKKLKNPRFSLKVLADHAGFKARDYLLRVMNGQRNLSDMSVKLLSKYFHFSDKNAEYFQSLVHFNQAKTGEAKEEAFRKLLEIQKYGKLQMLRNDQFEYLVSWHHAALRSYLPLFKKGIDLEEVGAAFDPPLTTKTVKDSVALLTRLGLLRVNRGRYSVGDAALSTGDEVGSLSVGAFHKETMELAKRAIDKHAAVSRDISGITMGISRAGYSRIKEEIRAFRKKIMAIAVNDSEEDRVYQLNLHLFSLTQPRGKQ